MLKALWNATIVFTTKIYRNYVYFNTTCVNHVANYNFRFLLCKFWYTCMVVYVHGCICPCVHNHPARVANSDGPLSKQRFTFVFLPKLQVGPGRPALHLALYNLAQHLSKFILTTCLMSWFKCVLFCFLPLCIQATVIMLILAPGVRRGSLSLGYDIYNTHGDK